jgi:hypothetical protein
MLARYALKNSKDHLCIPTCEGTGQVIHPDVVYFKDDWNGFKYWMAMTPYPYENDQYENPSVVVSNDGLLWSEPNGIQNPITPTPLVGHNCDCDMIYNPNCDQLWLYYIETDDLTYANVYLKTSQNGVDWGKKQLIISSKPRYSIIGQTVVYNCIENRFLMWYVNAGHQGGFGNRDRVIEYRDSIDGITWSNATTLLINSNYIPWHLDVIFLPWRNEYWMLYVGTNKSLSSALLFAVSNNRTDWTISSRPILGAPPNSWDSHITYRSTCIYDLERDLFRLWYSAATRNAKGQMEFYIGHTEEILWKFMMSTGVK